MSLTPRQRDLILFLQREIDRTGIGPSFDEMVCALGISSKGNVCNLLDRLEQRGYVRRVKHRARAIELLKRVPDPERPDAALAAYKAALMDIAVGEGVYGAQAHEYKHIARKVLEQFP